MFCLHYTPHFLLPMPAASDGCYLILTQTLSTIQTAIVFGISCCHSPSSAKLCFLYVVPQVRTLPPDLRTFVPLISTIKCESGGLTRALLAFLSWIRLSGHPVYLLYDDSVSKPYRHSTLAADRRLARQPTVKTETNMCQM